MTARSRHRRQEPTDPAEKIVLVTGASKGIGAATAVELARRGYSLWLNYRSDRAGAESVAEQARGLGVDCRLMAFDVADAEATAEALAGPLAEATPWAVVNNAGFTRDALFFWMEPAQWHDVLRVHLDGFYNVTKQTITGMIRRRSGRIINMVSTSGQMGLPGQANYAAAKAGIIGATKALARELAPRNVLVNAVAPGFIETAMTDEVPAEHVAAQVPMARMGKPEEVAGAVAFLCSADATYITGQVINVNGGIYM